jgi:hypothetical protein
LVIGAGTVGSRFTGDPIRSSSRCAIDIFILPSASHQHCISNVSNLYLSDN